MIFYMDDIFLNQDYGLNRDGLGDKNSHILPIGQRYAPSAVNYSAYSAHSA